MEKTTPAVGRIWSTSSGSATTSRRRRCRGRCRGGKAIPFSAPTASTPSRSPAPPSPLLANKTRAGLLITSECGKLQVSPGEMVVLPQGFRFAINLPDGPSPGYVAEVLGPHFQLPELGPIGANGLASPRDFLVPTAWFEESFHSGYTIVQKFGGELFTAKQDFSPFNVVAWHGNYVPHK